MEMEVVEGKNYVHVSLRPDEIVKAEPSAFLGMSGLIKMSTKGEGGLFKSFSRSMVGENFFIPTFKNVGETNGFVWFTPHYPADLKVLRLSCYRDHAFICQKKAYLCSSKNVDAKIDFTKKLGSALFGGEGFVLQKLQARPGYHNELVCIAAGGSIEMVELEEDEILVVETGALVGFESSIEYDVRITGGLFTMIAGGEDVFFTRLTGPGTVLIQTVPIERLADNIQKNTFSYRKLKKSE